jgi:hypothetical protein
METAMLDEIRIGDRIETGRASEFRGEIGSLGFCLQKVVYAVVNEQRLFIGMDICMPSRAVFEDVSVVLPPPILQS